MFDLISFVYGICSCLLFQLIIAVINDFFQSGLLKRAERKKLEKFYKSENNQRPSARGVAQGVSQSE